MNIEPFTVSEYNQLTGEQKNAIGRLYELSVGDRLTEPMDHHFEDDLELFHDAEPYALPSLLLDSNFHEKIHEKFWSIYYTASRIADEVHHFEPKVLVDPAIEDRTDVAVLSETYPHLVLLRVSERATYWHFKCLAALADHIIRESANILENLRRYTTHTA